jgi:hypothetical protein
MVMKMFMGFFLFGMMELEWLFFMDAFDLFGIREWDLCLRVFYGIKALVWGLGYSFLKRCFELVILLL